MKLWAVTVKNEVINQPGRRCHTDLFGLLGDPAQDLRRGPGPRGSARGRANAPKAGELDPGLTRPSPAGGPRCRRSSAAAGAMRARLLLAPPPRPGSQSLPASGSVSDQRSQRAAGRARGAFDEQLPPPSPSSAADFAPRLCFLLAKKGRTPGLRLSNLGQRLQGGVP